METVGARSQRVVRKRPAKAGELGDEPPQKKPAGIASGGAQSKVRIALFKL